MLNNNMKKLIACLFLIVGGVVFIVFGGITVKEIQNYPEVSAVVSHLEREWVPDEDGYDREEITVFVTYTVDGQEYTEELQNSKTNYKQGDEITVHYNPEDPTKVTGASKGGATLQFVFGGVLVLAGLGSAALTVSRGR